MYNIASIRIQKVRVLTSKPAMAMPMVGGSLHSAKPPSSPGALIQLHNGLRNRPRGNRSARCAILQIRHLPILHITPVEDPKRPFHLPYPADMDLVEETRGRGGPHDLFPPSEAWSSRPAGPERTQRQLCRRTEDDLYGWI